VTVPSRVDVSLDHLPASERFDFWQKKGSLYFVPSLIEAADRDHFSMSGTMLTLGSVVLVRCGGSRQVYTRDRSLIQRDGVDLFILDVLLEGDGEISVEPLGTQAVSAQMEPGTLFLLDLLQPSQFILESHTRLTALIPRELLGDASADLEGLHGRCLPQSLASGRLLLSFLQRLEQEAPHATAEEAEAMASGLAALVASSFFPVNALVAAGSAEGKQVDEEQLLKSVLLYVDRNLSDPDLSADRLAQSFGLSRSGLYRLFEAHGGVAAWVRERRLQLAYRLLLRAQIEGRRDLLIRDLTVGVGFTSEAHFSRLFKRRFGVTAQQLRLSTRADTQDDFLAGHGLDRQLGAYYDIWLRSLNTPPPPPR